MARCVRRGQGGQAIDRYGRAREVTTVDVGECCFTGLIQLSPGERQAELHLAKLEECAAGSPCGRWSGREPECEASTIGTVRESGHDRDREIAADVEDACEASCLLGLAQLDVEARCSRSFKTCGVKRGGRGTAEPPQ